MIATIHQPQYLPWQGYFDKADKAEIFILLDNVQFKKNEWQNRNKIKTPQGEQWLTVPVIHDFGQKINEVKINNQVPWREKHLKAIQLNYAKAPFFSNYFPFFKEAYAVHWKNLCDLNVFFVKELTHLLGIKTKIILASEYQVAEESTQRLVDLCHEVGCNTYLSGRDGGKYLDFNKFLESGIKVVTQDYQHPVYLQLWMKENNENFISHLSIIDILFNHAQESLKIMRASNPKEKIFL